MSSLTHLLQLIKRTLVLTELKFWTFVKKNGEDINKGVDLNLTPLWHWMLLNASINLAEYWILWWFNCGVYKFLFHGDFSSVLSYFLSLPGISKEGSENLRHMFLLVASLLLSCHPWVLCCPARCFPCGCSQHWVSCRINGDTIQAALPSAPCASESTCLLDWNCHLHQIAV